MKIFNPVVRGLSVGPAQTNFPIYISKIASNVAISHTAFGNYMTFNGSSETRFKAHPFGTYLLWLNVRMTGGVADANVTWRVNLNGSGTNNIIFQEDLVVPAGANSAIYQQILCPVFGTTFADITIQAESDQTDTLLLGNGTQVATESWFQLMQLGTNQS